MTGSSTPVEDRNDGKLPRRNWSLLKGDSPSSFNPQRLRQEVRTIESHGGMYADVLPKFRNIPNSEQYYPSADGHPDERRQPIVARILPEKLTDGTILALEVPTVGHAGAGR